MPPRVSVMMSVYNDAGRVEIAIRSILSQTLPEWELIVVDDGSTNATSEILDRLAASDSRIRVIHQDNTGLTRALIRGCTQARGEFIARQDADDWSHPRRLERQVALLESDPAIGFVSCWTQYIGPEDEPLEVLTRPADSELATRQLLEERQGPPAHGSVIFRRSLYEQMGGYRPEFYFGQDSDLWLRLAERSRIAYVPVVLYQARREVESISGSLRPLQKQFGQLGQACRTARRRGELEEPYLKEAAALTTQIARQRAEGTLSRGNGSNEMAYLIGSRLAQDGDHRAAKYLWRTICHRPWHWRAWMRLVQVGVCRGRRKSGRERGEECEG